MNHTMPYVEPRSRRTRVENLNVYFSRVAKHQTCGTLGSRSNNVPEVPGPYGLESAVWKMDQYGKNSLHTWTSRYDGMRRHYLQIRLVLFPNPCENRSSPPTSAPTASLLARGSVHVTISNLYTSSIHSSKLIRNNFISNIVEQTSS